MNILKLCFLFILITQFSHAAEFISEASGICRIGNTLVIAPDEEKDSLWISDDAGKIVKTKVQNGTWDDMEALTSIDAHSFYGVTSLGLSKKAERKEAREKIILFSHHDGKIKIEKEWFFRNDVLTFLAKEAKDSVDIYRTTTAPPKEGGLNVEGAVYRSGKLFLGLRSPLTKSGKAIILEVDVDKKSVTGWMAIDLKGNGIRDLGNDQDSILILAGPSDESDKKFALYNLKTSATLSRLSIPGFSVLLRPEGILKEKDGSLLLVQDFVEAQAQDFFVKLTP